jgi:hypothetical protein
MRMPIADILHRGVVTSLFGLTVFGVFMGVAIHRETLKKGRGKLNYIQILPVNVQPLTSLCRGV